MAGALRLAPGLAPAALTGAPRVPANPVIVLDWPLDDIRGGVPAKAASAFAAAALQVGHAAFLAGSADPAEGFLRRLSRPLLGTPRIATAASPDVLAAVFDEPSWPLQGQVLALFQGRLDQGAIPVPAWRAFARRDLVSCADAFAAAGAWAFATPGVDGDAVVLSILAGDGWSRFRDAAGLPDDPTMPQGDSLP